MTTHRIAIGLGDEHIPAARRLSQYGAELRKGTLIIEEVEDPTDCLDFIAQYFNVNPLRDFRWVNINQE